MDKKKVDPGKPSIEDLQGHSYQHELGDPDRAKQLEKNLDKFRKKRTVGKKKQTQK